MAITKEKRKTSKEENDRTAADAPAAKKRARKDSMSDDDVIQQLPAKKLKKEDSFKSKSVTILQQLEMALQSFKWWDAPAHEEGHQWFSLEHKGAMFPPPYVPIGVRPLYAGEPVDLTPEQEEVAPDGPQLGNPKSAKIFNENYWRDLKQYLGPNHKIKDFSKIDFTPMRTYLAERREERKSQSKEDKENTKIEKQLVQRQFGYAFVDNHLEKMGSYIVEPPGLFRGRGMHPKTGTIKLRVLPEQMTLNIGENDPVPPCPIPGHHWGHIVHKPECTWLSTWVENVMSSPKYIFLSASSAFRGKSDFEKYEKARKLKQFIEAIRNDYTVKLKSSDPCDRQMGSAVWIIDKLALRVGGEKGEVGSFAALSPLQDEADTVGCCSLRVEHLAFSGECLLTMDFLGKDSMRFFQTIDLSRYEDVGKRVYSNLKSFCKGKKKDDEVFDKLTVASLNNYLQSIMPGLTAKVFRTYNASITLESELPRLLPPGLSQPEQIRMYNDANRKVAILCNHQRTVPKTHDQQMDLMKERMMSLDAQIEDLKSMLLLVRKGKSVELRPESEDAESKKKNGHLFAKQPSEDQVSSRIAQFVERRSKLESISKNKEENKQVALGTSKINYMDPRITVAWCKRNEVPIERIFTRTLRDKFPWAMSVRSTWTF